MSLILQLFSFMICIFSVEVLSNPTLKSFLGTTHSPVDESVSMIVAKKISNTFGVEVSTVLPGTTETQKSPEKDFLIHEKNHDTLEQAVTSSSTTSQSHRLNDSDQNVSISSLIEHRLSSHSPEKSHKNSSVELDTRSKENSVSSNYAVTSSTMAMHSEQNIQPSTKSILNSSSPPLNDSPQFTVFSNVKSSESSDVHSSTAGPTTVLMNSITETMYQTKNSNFEETTPTTAHSTPASNLDFVATQTSTLLNAALIKSSMSLNAKSTQPNLPDAFEFPVPLLRKEINNYPTEESASQWTNSQVIFSTELPSKSTERRDSVPTVSFETLPIGHVTRMLNFNTHSASSPSSESEAPSITIPSQQSPPSRMLNNGISKFTTESLSISLSIPSAESISQMSTSKMSSIVNQRSNSNEYVARSTYGVVQSIHPKKALLEKQSIHSGAGDVFNMKNTFFILFLLIVFVICTVSPLI